jgi:hypothetical protein
MTDTNLNEALEMVRTPPEVAVDAVRAYIIAADDGFPSAEDASAALAALSQIEARLGELASGWNEATIEYAVMQRLVHEAEARLAQAEAALQEIDQHKGYKSWKAKKNPPTPKG